MGDLAAASFGYSASNVSLPSGFTTEVVAAPLVTTPRRTQRIFIFGWAQVTTGASGTGLRPEMRRHRGPTDNGVGLSVEQEIMAALTGTEPVTLAVSEDQENADAPEYRLHIFPNADAATALQAAILVLVM